MNLTLKVWRQKNASATGPFETYKAQDINVDMPFMEMLDIVNQDIIRDGGDPIAFDHDCREGICGTCGMVINGIPHGGHKSTTCQLYMRIFKDGDTITIEPWRAKAFPIIKDLVVDRTSLDNIIQAGGYISASIGGAPDANALPVPKDHADAAMDYAACIQCGACVAACPNGSAMLFAGAKVAHLGELPQGQPERYQRVVSMVNQMDEEGFGGCTNHGCATVCPARIPMAAIARLNRDLVTATLRGIS